MLRCACSRAHKQSHTALHGEHLLLFQSIAVPAPGAASLCGEYAALAVRGCECSLAATSAVRPGWPPNCPSVYLALYLLVHCVCTALCQPS